MKNMQDTFINKTVSYPETSFLWAMFSKFNGNDYKYCVLRNYSELPITAGGHDVDVLVSNTNYRSCCNEAVVVAESVDVKLISVVESFNVCDLAFIGKYDTKWWGVRFDIMGYVGTNAVPILSSSSILNRTKLHNTVKVANQNDSALLAFLKDIVGSGDDKKNYRFEAKKAFENERQDYLVRLNEKVGGSLTAAQLCDDFFLNESSYARSQSFLKKASARCQFKKSPFRFLKWKVLDFIYRSRRLINPPGFCIAVIGTDGSGKSTIIESVRKPLESALHNPIHYEHMRPNLLPSLAKLFGKEINEGPVTNPHASEPSSTISSLVRLTYYTLDYALGYWLKTRIKIARRPCLFVFDRYYYDYLIDPYRSRISLPQWIIRFYGLFVPDPDLIICLGTDPKIIHTRKPEIAFDEVARQVSELKLFCSKKQNAVWIDTGVSINESSDQVLKAITDRMASRYKSKFNVG